MTTPIPKHSVHICVLLICLSGYLGLADEKMLPGGAGDEHLVEVTFAADDKAPTEMFHTVVTLWLSKKSRGLDRDVYDWAMQGGYTPDTNSIEKASNCLKLMRNLTEPKDLPESPNQIVTVKCRDGDKTIVKKFSIQGVPEEVRQILTTMGFSDEHLRRLKFTAKTAEPGGSANGSQPVGPETNRTPSAAGSRR